MVTQIESFRKRIFNPELLTGNDQLIELAKEGIPQDQLTCLTKIKLKDPRQEPIVLLNGVVCTREFLRDTMLRLEMMQQMQPDVLAALYHRAQDPKSAMTDVQKSFAEAWRMGETADLPLSPRPKMNWKSFWSGATPFAFPSITAVSPAPPRERLSFSLSADRGNVLRAAVRLVGKQIVLVNPING